MMRLLDATMPLCLDGCAQETGRRQEEEEEDHHGGIDTLCFFFSPIRFHATLYHVKGLMHYKLGIAGNRHFLSCVQHDERDSCFMQEVLNSRM